MPYLTIGGNTIEVQGVSEALEETGDSGATFDGSWRQSIRSRKRVWGITTTPYARATADTVEGYLTATGPLTASGDLVEDSGGVSVYINGISRSPIFGLSGAELVRISFTMREA